nr:uncharacterized protein LOC111513985 isoform X2 [Leptinotarsa decemlineata]
MMQVKNPQVYKIHYHFTAIQSRSKVASNRYLNSIAMLRNLTVILFVVEFAFARIYDRCELAKELRHVHDFPEEHISTWVCIVQHESQFNTSAMNPGSGDHGLFQISQLYWCSPPGDGFACNTACSSFRDDNISDDVRCVKKIYKEHTRLSGNGFNAWAVYPLYCKGDTSKYIGGCPGNLIDNTVSSTVEEEVPVNEDDDGYDFPPLPGSPKVYSRCELAKELKNVHKFPEEQISKWVCIAEHESNFNTSANNKGSGDHGLFQISEQYWCSPYGRGLGCNANCASFRDRSIADDVKCIRLIYQEHTAISGDGFNAWVVYPLYCKGDTSSYIRGCFGVDDDGYDFPRLPSPPKTVLNNIVGNAIEDDGYEFPSLPSTEKTLSSTTRAPSPPKLNVGVSNSIPIFSYYSSSTVPPKIPAILFETKQTFSTGFSFAGNTPTTPKSLYTFESNPTINITKLLDTSSVPKKQFSNNLNIVPSTFPKSSVLPNQNTFTTKSDVFKSSTYSPFSTIATKTPSIKNTAIPFLSSSSTPNNASLSPKARQLTFKTFQPFTMRQRTGIPRHTRPPGFPPRPSRPNASPARPSRPGPPPPPAGPIFTLRPTTFTGPVATSVYVTSPKPLGRELKAGASDRSYFASASSLSKVLTSSSSSVPSTTSSSTVKRSDSRASEQFPGYSFSRTRLGFRLFHNSRK